MAVPPDHGQPHSGDLTAPRTKQAEIGITEKQKAAPQSVAFCLLLK
jgi:hypothetical protein